MSFELSAGVLFFPITLLITDIMTEFYGKSYTYMAVKICLINSLLIISLVGITRYLPATSWSLVSNQDFYNVFSIYDISVFASIISFYVCQITDIYLFSGIKKITKGKHLWLRNNISSIISQALDTVLVVSILTAVGIIPYDKAIVIIAYGYSFKVIVALLDTPFCYLLHFYIGRKWFDKSYNKKPLLDSKLIYADQ